MSDGAAGARARRRTALATGVLGLALYSRSLASGFVYDDWLHIVAEPVPATLGQLARLFAQPMSPLVPYYRPIPRLLNVAQHALHGPTPWAYHAVNLALALGCALALAALLRSRAFAARERALGIAALVFLAHPITSECVYAAASGRETLLPTLFTLLACGAYFRATRAGRALALGAFALGLLSKEQAIAVPFLLALADALGIAPGRPRGVRGWLARYAPHAGVVVAYALVRRAAVPAALAPGIALFDAPAGPPLSLLYHLQTTFAPFARVVYEPPLAVWWSPLRLAAACVLAAALGFAAARRDVRRTLWWLAFVALSLAPTANLLAQSTHFAERWGLAALAGWAGLLALALGDAGAARATVAPATGARAAGSLRERASSSLRARAPLALATAALGAFAACSYSRASAYRDDEAFLAQWLRTNPHALQAHISLGEAHERRGDWAGAAAQYRAVLAESPSEPLAHASLAIALAQLGERAEAEAEAARAVALDPSDAESWSNLAALRLEAGDVTGALADAQRALALRPGLASAHNQLGLALKRSGDLAGARAELEAALDAREDFAEAHANLADVLQRQGDRAGARRQLERALSLEPELTPARDALRALDAPPPPAPARAFAP